MVRIPVKVQIFLLKSEEVKLSEKATNAGRNGEERMLENQCTVYKNQLYLTNYKTK